MNKSVNYSQTHETASKSVAHSDRSGAEMKAELALFLKNKQEKNTEDKMLTTILEKPKKNGKELSNARGVTLQKKPAKPTIQK